MYILAEGLDITKICKPEILESSLPAHSKPKAKVRTVLQTLDDVNKNKRIYPKIIFERALGEVLPLVENRYLVGELDHPLLTGNEQADSLRHFLVLYERVSHIFNKVFLDGKTVMGEVETCLTDCGFNMAGLIMDGVPVGFSLRAMGETRTRHDGVTEISNPFNIITFDCVSNPSHAKARMIEVVESNFSGLNESVIPNLDYNNVAFDRTNILHESFSYKKTRTASIYDLLTDLEINVRNNRVMEAESDINELLKRHLRDELVEQRFQDFLVEYLNEAAPLSDLIKKYL